MIEVKCSQSSFPQYGGQSDPRMLGYRYMYVALSARERSTFSGQSSGTRTDNIRYVPDYQMRKLYAHKTKLYGMHYSTAILSFPVSIPRSGDVLATLKRFDIFNGFAQICANASIGESREIDKEVFWLESSWLRTYPFRALSRRALSTFKIALWCTTLGFLANGYLQSLGS
jgi:hypothetical protein